jgi:anaerobic selenocysteine-containing dehydrogenase
MADGKLAGSFVMGENPVVGTVGGPLQREGLAALEWLVVRDFAPSETAELWRIAPEIERGEVRSEDIQTEVFFFPAAAHTEKDGSFTNTQRLLQWHHAAIEPPGDARSELWFTHHLGRRRQARYAASIAAHDRAIRRAIRALDRAGERAPRPACWLPPRPASRPRLGAARPVRDRPGRPGQRRRSAADLRAAAPLTAQNTAPTASAPDTPAFIEPSSSSSTPAMPAVAVTPNRPTT